MSRPLRHGQLRPAGVRAAPGAARRVVGGAALALFVASLSGLVPGRAAAGTGSPMATGSMAASVDAVPAGGRPLPGPAASPAGFAANERRPGPANTGVPAGTRLRRHDGDLHVTRRGTHLDALDVHGFVFVEAPDVTLSRSVVRGRATGHDTGLVNVTDRRAKRFLLQDSELVPARPSVRIDGIKGRGYTVRRTEIRATVDGVKVFGDDVLVEASWLHDMQWFRHDPSQGGGHSHNDGVQVLGGSHIRILGNTISGADNAALQVTQGYSATTDLVFRGNWADGGGCTVNLANAGRSRLSGMTVDANRFGRHTRVRNCPVLATRRTTVGADRNVWDDTGRSVRIRRNG